MLAGEGEAEEKIIRDVHFVIAISIMQCYSLAHGNEVLLGKPKTFIKADDFCYFTQKAVSFLQFEEVFLC